MAVHSVFQSVLKLCWLQQCTLFCYFGVGCAGCGSVLPWSVSLLVLAQSVVLVCCFFLLAVAVHFVFLLWGWCMYIVLAVAVQVAALGWQFCGDGCGSSVCCDILKLVFVVLAAAVHSVVCAGVYCAGWGSAGCFAALEQQFYGSAVCCVILNCSSALCFATLLLVFVVLAVAVLSVGDSFLAAALQSVVLVFVAVYYLGWQFLWQCSLLCYFEDGVCCAGCGSALFLGWCILCWLLLLWGAGCGSAVCF